MLSIEKKTPKNLLLEKDRGTEIEFSPVFF